MALPTGQTLSININVLVGNTQGKEKIPLAYTEPSSTTAMTGETITLKLAAGASNTQLDTSTRFNTGKFIAIKEITTGTSGFKVGTGSTDKFTVAGGGFLAYRANEQPILYFDNADGSNEVILEIGLAGDLT